MFKKIFLAALLIGSLAAGNISFAAAAEIAPAEPHTSEEHTSDSYSVTVEQSRDGTGAVSPETAQKGGIVTVKTVPNAGFIVGNVTAAADGCESIAVKKVKENEYTFVMPEADVCVTPSFVKQDDEPEPKPAVDDETKTGFHKIYMIQCPNGSVIVSPGEAEKGAVIEVSAVPDKGYEVCNITVADINAVPVEVKKVKENNYTFVMADAHVLVVPSFSKVQQVNANQTTDTPDKPNGSSTPAAKPSSQTATTTQTPSKPSVAKPQSSTSGHSKPSASSHTSGTPSKSDSTNKTSGQTSQSTSNKPASKTKTTIITPKKSVSVVNGSSSMEAKNNNSTEKSKVIDSQKNKKSDSKTVSAAPAVKIISVYVPLDLPITQVADGTVIVPDEASIMSSVREGDICVADVNVKLAIGWEPVDDTESGLESNQIDLALRGDSLESSGVMKLEKKNWIIEAKKSLDLNMKAEIQDGAKLPESSDIATIEFVLGWA